MSLFTVQVVKSQQRFQMFCRKTGLNVCKREDDKQRRSAVQDGDIVDCM